MDSCSHDEACHTFIADSWGFWYPSPPYGSGCGLSTKESHHNAESAKGEWLRIFKTVDGRGGHTEALRGHPP